MKIVLFEDTGGVLYAGDLLNELQHDVWHTMDFRDVMYWAEIEPGADAFDAWIFDLNAPSNTLARAEDEECYDIENWRSDCSRNEGKPVYTMPDYDCVHREMSRPGVTLQLLWMEYSDEYSYFGGVARIHYDSRLVSSQKKKPICGISLLVDQRVNTQRKRM